MKSKNLKKILDLVYQENQERRDLLTNNPDGSDPALKSESNASKDYEIACADQNVLSLNYLHALPTESVMTHLTSYPGIGPKTALKWHRAGIEDVEDLACTKAGDERLAGFSLERQRKLIQQAEQLVKTFDSDITREPAPSIKRSELELDIQGHFDPVRLSRALGLNVTPQVDSYLVTGGHNPHFVSTDLACDCPDYRWGRPCKHVLAVQLHRGDPQTVRNAELIAAT